MPVETGSVNEYETVVVGAGYLVKGILQRLGVAQAIDSTLSHQPEIEATYGALAQGHHREPPEFSAPTPVSAGR